MNWSNSWDDKPKQVWGEPVPKPYGQVLKEWNEAAERQIRETTGLDTLPKAPIREVINLNIPISVGWGRTHNTTALKVGDLAVHHSIPDNGTDYDWCITHIPTLTCFDAAVPEGDYTQEELIVWCWKVQQIHDVEWSYLRNLNNKNYNTEESKLWRDRILNHCLSVPVK